MAALLGGLSVALGAFAAHGLKQRLGTTEPEAITTFQTGVQYQMYHALALLAVGILFEKFSTPVLRRAGSCFLWGILFFSGSLYAITACKLAGAAVPRFIGPITPVGGLFFIAGWLLLFLAIAKGNK